MGKGNAQNRKKVEELKVLIAQKMEIDEIIKKKFGNSKNRLRDWLNDFQEKLTTYEIEYLKKAEEPTVIEEIEEVEEKEVINYPKKAEFGEVGYISSKVYDMGDIERESFLKSNIVIQKLLELVNGTITLNKKEIDTNLVIPKELKHIEDTGVKNIRVSLNFYKRFVEVTKENGVSIVDATNLMFQEFLNKYEK